MALPRQSILPHNQPHITHYLLVVLLSQQASISLTNSLVKFLAFSCSLLISFHTTFVYFPSTITTTTITDTTTFPILFLLLLQLLILILVVNSSFAPSSSLLLFSFLLLGYIVFQVNRLYQIRQAKIRPKVRKKKEEEKKQ